jgi:hypothetical protein
MSRGARLAHLLYGVVSVAYFGVVLYLLARFVLALVL